MMEWVTDFHFLRPWWLLALLPGVILALSRRLFAAESSSWSQIIAPSLLPYLTRSTGQEQQRRCTRWVLALAWSLICVGLAGPTAAELPQPLQRDTNALVVLFDLSPSMRVRDLTPDRLTRARLKTIDFLRERREGMTGLVIYAGDAYTLAPMTPDLNTILHLVPELEPEIMPEPGSYVEAALRQGLELLINGGHRTGRVLLVTDGMTYGAQQNLEQLIRQFAEYHLDILGVGTTAGGPIPLPDGTFARASDGRIAVDSLPEQRLRNLAQRAGGRYATLTADDRDLDHLLAPYRQTYPQPHGERTVEATTEEFDLWHDLGYWLALALLPLIVVLFRRGVIAALVIWMPLTFHSPPAAAFAWPHLWATPDQRASRALARGDAGQAADEFQDPAWRGVAAYTAGDYEAAEYLFSQQDTAAAHYNRGNALAAQGRFAEAIDAYDEALTLTPELAAAQRNRARAEELLQQQQQEPTSPSDGDSDASGENRDSQQTSQQTPQQPPSHTSQPQDDSDAESGDRSAESSSTKPAADTQPTDTTDPISSGSELKGENVPEADQESPHPESADENSARESPSPAGATPSPEQEPQLDTDETLSPAAYDPRHEQMEQQLRRVPEDPGGVLRRQLQREALLRARESQRVRSLPPGSEQDRW